MSLGNWFRDYVYTPTVRSLTEKEWTKKLNKPFLACDAMALVVTWTLTGIWHGSGLQFLIYGLWFCLFIVFERLRNERRKTMKKQGKLKTLKRTGWRKAVDHVMTMLVVAFGMVFFRADSLGTAMGYIKKMLIWDTADGILMLHQYNNYLAVFLIIALVFIFPVYGKIKDKVQNLVTGTKWAMVARITYKLSLIVAFLLSFGYMVSSGYTPFLYEVF